MWSTSPTTQWEKDRKYYEKKHPRELAAVLNNLGRYIDLLNRSKKAACAEAGYLHGEGAGVVAIDQKAGGKSLQETRMYIFANEAEKVLYLITIGNKDSQHDDVLYSRDFVKEHFPPPEQTKPD